jgi:hypothetical protein
MMRLGLMKTESAKRALDIRFTVRPTFVEPIAAQTVDGTSVAVEALAGLMASVWSLS